MAILEGDIKLLESAVMSDTLDGGGAMTGVEIIDGRSNNLFPDTDAMSRARGRVRLRKVFGVAHSDNTDWLLGSHAIITAPPEDPLVHCALMLTPGWADTRERAREIIERYLVKGSRTSPRMMDTHYAGSLQLRLISAAANADFPRAGDAIALVAPDGHEQYVRVTKVKFSTQTFYISEGGSTVEFVGTIGTLDLGQRLDYDFPGPPISRVAPSPDTAYSKIYNTTLASGARLVGIKPLTAAASMGDIGVQASGIYHPLVPAATIETLIIDQYPLAGRGALCSAAYGAVSISTAGAIGPGVKLTTPSPIEPKSLALTLGGTAFTDNGLGQLLQGATVVAGIDYAQGTITFAATAPAYGAGSIALAYRPATRADAPCFSAELPITTANQGLAFVTVLEPPPAPGSLTLDYMAQGRWYTLADNMVGKLAGPEPSYGVGTVSSETGSLATTLGAMPDVGSSLIAQWGDASAVKAVEGDLPTRLYAALPLPGAVPLGITATWQRGTSTYTASTNASGILSGHAAGSLAGGSLEIAPDVFPSGAISVTYKSVETVNGTFENTGNRTFTAAGVLPVNAGTVHGTAYFASVYAEKLWDRNGAIYANLHGENLEIGWIDYATGIITFFETASVITYGSVSTTADGGWQTGMQYGVMTATSSNIHITGGSDITYGYGVQSDQTVTITPSAWLARIPTQGLETVNTTGAMFTVGADVYSSSAGVLRKGWSLTAGAPAVASAGAITSQGAVQVSSLPSNGINTVSWKNLVQDRAAGLVSGGVFRTASAPLKVGVFQLQSGSDVGTASEGGEISGEFSGSVDFERGIARWSSIAMVEPDALSYNAVFLQYLPIDASLLGLETARLPLDGRVPIFRPGDLVVVHHTQTYALPNPLVKGTVYNVGRVRLAAMKVKTQTGAVVDTTLYTHNLDAGTLVFPADADLSGLAQPFKVEHRIEDMLVCSVADISGRLTFTSSLTHNFPAGSYVSSALNIGDLYARAYNPVVQTTWTGDWSDELIGSAPLANYNNVASPMLVTNRGAITERWAFIFTSSTTFRAIGEHVGEIGTGSTGADFAPVNPATSVPYFVLPALGWGSGWSAGNVYRRNTAACGAPFWVVMTILQGPTTLLSDKFQLAYRADVDRP